MKHCLYKGCKNREKYKTTETKGIFLIPFPKPSTKYEKCKIWLKALNREDITVKNINSRHYVCSKHFVGGNGPTLENPNPIPDKQSGKNNTLDVVKMTHTYSKITDTVKIPIQNAPQPEILHFSCDMRTPNNEECYVMETIKDEPQDEEPVNILGNTSNNNHAILPATETYAINEECYVMETIKDEPQDEESIQILGSTNNNHAILPATETYAINGYQVINEANEQSYMNVAEWPSMIGATMMPITSIMPQFSTLEYSESSTQVPEATATTYSTELVKIVADYLSYQANNLNDVKWFLTSVSPESCEFKHSSLTLEINSSLAIKISSFSKILSDDHPIFSKTVFNPSVPITRYERLVNIMHEIDSWRVCNGITKNLLEKFCSEYIKAYDQCETSKSIRSKSCTLLYKNRVQLSVMCEQCRIGLKALQDRNKRASKLTTDVCSKNTNKRYMTSKEIEKRSQLVRESNLMLKRKIVRLQKTITKMKNKPKKDFPVNLEEPNHEINPFEHRKEFQKLMLREQCRFINSNKTRPKQWHPAIVEWAHFIMTDSPASYEIVNQALTLPGSRTLQKYAKQLESLNSVKETSQNSPTEAASSSLAN